MSRLRFQVTWQVDDVDGLKGTLPHAYATADAQLFRDGGYLGGRGHFDTQLARTNHL